MQLNLNPHHGTPGLVVLPSGGWRRAQETLASWPGRGDVVLRDDPDRAAALSVARYATLDDGGLWGGSITALGGAYGAMQVVLAALGRHSGQGAALWQRDGAGVMLASVSDGTHAAGVRAAASAWGAAWTRDPAAGAWISPIATPGYTETPREIMQAYRLAADAALDNWEGHPPTHILVPGGAGALAAALSVHLRPWAARLVVVTAADYPHFGQPVDPPFGPLFAADARLGPAISLLAWQELERGAWATLHTTCDGSLAPLNLTATDSVLDATLLG